MRVGEIRENKAMSGLRIKGLGEEIATLANLPWDQSLESWPEDEVLTGMRGISRHVVRLIRYYFANKTINGVLGKLIKQGVSNTQINSKNNYD